MTKRGTHTKEDTPIREFFMTVGGGGTILVLGYSIFVNPEGFSLLIFTLPLWVIAFLFKKENVVRWKD